MADTTPSMPIAANTKAEEIPHSQTPIPQLTTPAPSLKPETPNIQPSPTPSQQAFIAYQSPSTIPYLSIAGSNTQPETKSAVSNIKKGLVLISPFKTTKNISLFVLGFLMAVIVVDGIIISRRRIARIGGRTFAHLSFLAMIFIIALILQAGKIM